MIDFLLRLDNFLDGSSKILLFKKQKTVYKKIVHKFFNPKIFNDDSKIVIK